MKQSILILIGTLVIISCQKNDDYSINQLGDVCDYRTEILPPEGFMVSTVGEADFNGNVENIQFVNEQTGFALASKNVGGYVDVYKTTDGGQTWTNLDIGINQYPRSMIFKDENFGIITVHDVTGCPPPNCQNKSVILKTENGGLDWEEVEFEELKGVLYHPKFDSKGNLYAYLQSSIIKSTDNGETWDTLFSSPELDFALLTFSFELFEDRIYISAKDGKIVVINTHGELIKTIAINKSPIWDVEIIDENNLVIVVSGEVIKSTNGGETWTTIYDHSARMIGFDSTDKGLMILKKSTCPTDVYQVNDVIASTNNGGINWTEAKETTTDLRKNYVNSQKIRDGIWYIMIDNKLIEIKEK
jgi:photosystem II stability/assembly factor-like uncharacterized protein